jgi:hypothetical protein
VADSPLLAAFAQQAQWCAEPAPFSSRVLQAAGRWLAQDQTTHDEIAALAGDAGPIAAALPLRLLAGLHHLALLGVRPWQALWPPNETTPDDATLESAVAHAWHFRHEHMQRAMAVPPQTNEVQRSAVLLPGLLHVAAQTGLPLALVEIGASAGLNLWADQYRYEAGSWAWGAADSALVLTPEWAGAAPPQADLRIDYRAACDAQPVDLSAEGEALRLASFIWADQPERLARLQAAAVIASREMATSGVKVQAAPAPTFLRQQLSLRLPGQAMVVMHSVMWQYMSSAEQAAIQMLLQTAGSSATPDTPLAWLRMEPPQPDVRMELRCRIWPGGDDVLLAHCHPHGAKVDWQTAGR